MRRLVFALGGIALCMALSACQTAVTSLEKGETGSLSYPGMLKHTLKGNLQIPETTAAKVPAVILVHGAGGIDSRQSGWASFLRKQGYATMTIDYFSPRGISGRSVPRPPRPTSDITDAANLLGTHPRIDPDRIAVIGWSNGATMAIDLASQSGGSIPEDVPIKGFVAIYPVCQLASLGANRRNEPVLILLGDKDSFTTPDACNSLVERAKMRKRDARLVVYEGVYHGWDGNYSGSFPYSGFGTVTIRSDHSATSRSREDVMAFLREVLGPVGQ